MSRYNIPNSEDFGDFSKPKKVNLSKNGKINDEEFADAHTLGDILRTLGTCQSLSKKDWRKLERSFKRNIHERVDIIIPF